MSAEGGQGEGELILYRTEDGRDAIQLRLVDGTVWLTQAEIALLFDTTKQNVSLHFKSIFADAELAEGAVVKESLTTAADGKRYATKLYNLNAILAVGYRVRSARGVQFRRWATEVLNDYLVKGFVMNDDRLKDPAGTDYFDELLERIRDIRASEKRFYQKVRDLFAATSADYDPKAETAKTFFATIQNKLVFAITGMTAAELIVARADPSRPNMALTSWKGERVRKADVAISKNYLTAEEISDLNLLTTAFLDFAELRARNRQPTTMAEWMAQTDRFVAFNERALLQGSGRVSHARMEQIVAERFDAFDQRRRAAETDAAEAEAISDLAELEQQARQLSKPPAGKKPTKKSS
ncbi:MULTISPECIES: virulence RhuM family protein [Rhodopseudomonas]|uniref:2-hydroxyacid dehydrogenase n=1 Tax=Rhodopseudomonas palustris TaxID=1076 RepID=A0A0D7ESE7_RHOPL|nr:MULTISPECIES: virulence RhuM family protein [Rhodopseudomonas]KIZ43708.1 2-hydroxyacid dehydrogenase [Rhodopseudomonas palustris]MDF3810305.1 virulence RhuM family protein [Rhodopseudomonas sp. BAL398]WOK20195.1 virulence RhuM family protein [Rhodopseudomonas sp. BAL398]